MEVTTTYDKYYQAEHLFGEPYPELITFFTEYPLKGKVLDLGCGQGRDAIALARLGYHITGIDSSQIGIQQMTRVAQTENLDLVGRVGDIYQVDNLAKFDFVLLDSMFHFAKRDREKEVGLIQKIISTVKKGCLIMVCIQDTGNKVQILNQALDFKRPLIRLADTSFKYTFEDRDSGHRSESDYRMIVVETN